jgi:hypothetical protein
MLFKKKQKKEITKKNYNKKIFFYQTDRQTDTRSAQNYSSEPHKRIQGLMFTGNICLFRVNSKLNLKHFFNFPAEIKIKQKNLIIV